MSTMERVGEAVRLTGVSAYGVRFTDLVVRYGEVVVLTGPNGAGKSTVSRLVVGELTATGSVQVLDADPAAGGLTGRIGYLVKDLETMGSLTSRDVLDICAAVRGCGTAFAHQVAARIGLELDRPMGQLSRGQLRRLGIVQALMHEPELIVLDDPMTELDDSAREVLPVLLHEAADRGAAVLVTAQAESDAKLCEGRIVQLMHSDAEPEVLGVQQAYDGQHDKEREHGDRYHPDRDRHRAAPPWDAFVVLGLAVRPTVKHLSPPCFSGERSPAAAGRWLGGHGSRGGDSRHFAPDLTPLA